MNYTDLVMRAGRVFCFLLVCVIVGASSSRLDAHHSTAGYDLIHGTIVSGTVTKFLWQNPHATLALDVAGDGDTEHWSVEMDSPAVLSRLGWSKDTLHPGDRITLIGSRAKDPSFRIRAGYVEWPDGRKLRCLPPDS